MILFAGLIGLAVRFQACLEVFFGLPRRTEANCVFFVSRLDLFAVSKDL